MSGLKIESAAGVLSAIVRQVLPSVTGRSTLPILNHLHFRAEAGTLIVEGCDLEMWMIRQARAVSVLAPGAFTVDAKLISALLAKLPPADPVTIEGAEKGGCALKSLGRKYALAGCAAAEYPQSAVSVGDPVCVELPSSALLMLLKNTMYAAEGRNGPRPVVQSVNFNSEKGTLQCVATDTHQLALSTSGVECDPINAILPIRFAQIVAGQLSETDNLVRIVFDAHSATFTVGDLTISARLTEGQYPNFRRVFPVEFASTVIINREELLSSAQRVLLVGAEWSDRVVLDFAQSGVRLWANGNAAQEAAEEISAVSFEGEPVQTAFNGKYLIECLSVFASENIRIQIVDARRTSLFDDPGGAGRQCSLICPMGIPGVNE